MAMCLCYWFGSRRVWRPVCFVHAQAASLVIPRSDSDSAVHPAPDDPDAARSIKDALDRIKQREAREAVLFRLHNAMTGLENAATEARVAIKSYDDFCASAEVGLSPSQTFSADSRAEGVSILLPLGTGSQEGGAGERTNAAAPPSQSAPAKLKRPSRAVWP